MAVSNAAPIAPAAPAPSAFPAAGAPATPSLARDSIPSIDDLFSTFEKQMTPEPTQDLRGTKESKELSYDDLMNIDDEEQAAAEEVTEESVIEQGIEGEAEVLGEEPASTEASNSEIDYAFEQEIGGVPVKLHIKTPEQLNTIISKAYIADKLWKENLKYKNETMPQLQERADYADTFDKLAAEKPFDLMDTIVEDLPEEAFKEWIIRKADELGKDPQQKALDKRLRHAEMVERKLQEMEEREQAQKQRTLDSQRKSDEYTVKTWAQSVGTRLQSKVPVQYHNLIEREIKNAIVEVNNLHKQTPGTQLSVQQLEKTFAKNFKPIFELLQSSGKKPDIKGEVGKVLEGKKAQNLSRIQAAASSARGPAQTKSRMQRYIDDNNPIGALDFLMAQMDNGKFTVMP